jgi:hypothetical protein
MVIGETAKGRRREGSESGKQEGRNSGTRVSWRHGELLCLPCFVQPLLHIRTAGTVALLLDGCAGEQDESQRQQAGIYDQVPSLPWILETTDAKCRDRAHHSEAKPKLEQLASRVVSRHESFIRALQR